MRGILLRVGCDSTPAGGNWNAPVDPATWKYAYVPIPGSENEYRHISPCPTYQQFRPAVERLGTHLPPNLTDQTKVHLDPDFVSLSYGDVEGPRGNTVARIGVGDFIAFFAAFHPTKHWNFPLVYCLIGLFFVARVNRVEEIPLAVRHRCAHGRRIAAERDYVFWGTPRQSGRFHRALPIGEYRDRAYRVRRDLLTAWGGLTVNDGYIQRSARPPLFRNPDRFLSWLERQPSYRPLMHEN